MKKSVILWILLLILVRCHGQVFLLVENDKTLKNFKYYPGDVLSFSLGPSQGRITDQITGMTDSTLIFEYTGEVGIDRLVTIYRSNWLMMTLSSLSMLAGAGYIGLDSFNRLINREYPVIDAGTALVSAALIGGSFALMPFHDRRLKCHTRWKLKVLDQSSF
ncbi:MAG TPA: hypothetical protein PLW31_01495 [Bacteroidales bacterium]|nr:hypothetical protein [Bacteroidales bacterium]HOX76685.1 hypothetical protein [Bacteroidales bacterium]HPI86890.1 hypothetical protein [Bacteroidales bacterium]HPM92219.1 hypothetical protein [Bacteroidales bacterium]